MPRARRRCLREGRVLSAVADAPPAPIPVTIVRRARHRIPATAVPVPTGWRAFERGHRLAGRGDPVAVNRVVSVSAKAAARRGRSSAVVEVHRVVAGRLQGVADLLRHYTLSDEDLQNIGASQRRIEARITERVPAGASARPRAS